jgi:hypothetical protein
VLGYVKTPLLECAGQSKCWSRCDYHSATYKLQIERMFCNTFATIEVTVRVPYTRPKIIYFRTHQSVIVQWFSTGLWQWYIHYNSLFVSTMWSAHLFSFQKLPASIPTVVTNIKQNHNNTPNTEVIWFSRRGVWNDCLLRCCAVKSRREWPTFQRRLLPLSSGFRTIAPSQKTVIFKPDNWSWNAELISA